MAAWCIAAIHLRAYPIVRSTRSTTSIIRGHQFYTCHDNVLAWFDIYHNEFAVDANKRVLNSNAIAL